MQKKSSDIKNELALLYGLGDDVFDSKKDFRQWLKSPSKSLGNRRPNDLLDSFQGIEDVQREITRIQYNVYC